MPGRVSLADVQTRGIICWPKCGSYIVAFSRAYTVLFSSHSGASPPQQSPAVNARCWTALLFSEVAACHSREVVLKPGIYGSCIRSRAVLGVHVNGLRIGERINQADRPKGWQTFTYFSNVLHTSLGFMLCLALLQYSRSKYSLHRNIERAAQIKLHSTSPVWQAMTAVDDSLH